VTLRDLSVVTESRELIDRVLTGLFVGGEFTAAAGGHTLVVEDPSNRAPLAEVADANAGDSLNALTAAHEAMSEWAETAPRTRSELLRAAYDRVQALRRQFALLISLEMGKTLADAEAEVSYAAEFLRWYSEEAVRINGRTGQAPGGGGQMLVTKRPVGPCLLITPWNFPLAMVTRKVAPALAAGCTVVVKPSELTPLTALLFADTLRDVGVPTGVVNVVNTTSAGEVVGALMGDGRLRKISFTGSTAVGSHLLQQAAPGVLRTSMELGGNAPFIVLEDADVTAAVEGALVAKIRNGGQSCVGANRFLVHESLAEEFASGLASRFGDLRVGPGQSPGVGLGPLINSDAVDRVEGLVEAARAQGANVLCGGQRGADEGHFYLPTVLTDVPSNTDVVQSEIFGPVAPIVTISDDDHAVSEANSTPFGLVAYVYSQDLRRALSLGNRIETGMFGVNRGLVSDAAAPFGGAKASGLGREGGPEGLAEYLETHYALV
jgi:succinate-semialdehyde dehydrogenase/glutarate-semialdehyde dehydrogenase